MKDLSHLVDTQRTKNGAAKRPGWLVFLDRALGAVVWGILGWFGLMALGGLARLVVCGVQAGWWLAGRILL